MIGYYAADIIGNIDQKIQKCPRIECIGFALWVLSPGRFPSPKVSNLGLRELRGVKTPGTRTHYILWI